MDRPTMRSARRRLRQAPGLLALCFAFPPPARAAETPDPKPNIVFIVADDLGWADLGCYGADLHETPNLDRLAAQGIRFTDAYAAAPICSPTRASYMSGKYPARLNMTIWREGSLDPPTNKPLLPAPSEPNLPLSEVLISERLKEAGYLTAHIGKWHLGDTLHYPESQGFDVDVGATWWGAPVSFFYPYKGAGFGELRYVPGLDTDRDRKYFADRKGEYLTDRLTDEALKVMTDAGDRPFFLHLAYHTVHTPIEGKPDLVSHYEQKLKPGMNHQNAAYAAMVHSLDENVGRILAKVDALGIADRTIVVFYSDNGGFINPHKGQRVTNNHPLRSGKGSLYEGGIRVPLIVRQPGATNGGTVCREPVTSMDLYSTMLAMAGIAAEPKRDSERDGLNLVSLLEDPRGRLKRDTLYWHYPHYYWQRTTPVGAIRKGDWKLLEYFEDGRLELYNLKDDLGETTNLAEKMPGKTAELHGLLKNWRREVDARMPTPNPAFQKR